MGVESKPASDRQQKESIRQSSWPRRITSTILATAVVCRNATALSSIATPRPPAGLQPDPIFSKASKKIDVSFSHIHLYVDSVEDVSVYKSLEDKLNRFAHEQKKQAKGHLPLAEDIDAYRELYQSIAEDPSFSDNEFKPQNRDVVKQLLSGLGFRVTGKRVASDSTETNTKSVLVTSKDASGVQMIVTAMDESSNHNQDLYHHFDASNLDRFSSAHDARQGIAVLGFEISSADELHARYTEKHPTLVLGMHDYGDTKMLEVFAFYRGDTADSGVDKGTVLRFVEPIVKRQDGFCVVPGLIPVDASYDESCRAAYCDHWVSNVVSRTSFLNTLEETLGFTPKVDFNAGVVAAGEAQIESTVTGNDGSSLSASTKDIVLRDQRQVYLPINNALSEVGHVHGFLKEIGQGVQHIASRVDNLIEFVQRGNDYRKITGEGFTFLNIPRSYYGILNKESIMNCAHSGSRTLVSESCAQAILDVCEQRNIVTEDFAVDLELRSDEVEHALDSGLTGSPLDEFRSNREQIVDSIFRSRYSNLYNLLGNHLSEESYLGIVRNKILVDVQGEDLLFQIFTSNILQRNPGDEAPFFEFIQRVCSQCVDEKGRSVNLKPGCGGFGIRNFLTLFLSIEVSKAMLEASDAKARGDVKQYDYARQMVECFTNQLNEANPILTEISDAMSKEGKCRDELKNLQTSETNEDITSHWQVQMEAAAQEKALGNAKLMKCSSKYKNLMKAIREGYTPQQ